MSNSTVPPQSSFPGQGVSIQYPAKKYKTAYPISTYTYALVNQNGETGISDVKNFLSWAVTTGQKYGAQLKFYEKIKDAVDPDGILSPGKQGIWPKALRATA